MRLRVSCVTQINKLRVIKTTRQPSVHFPPVVQLLLLALLTVQTPSLWVPFAAVAADVRTAAADTPQPAVCGWCRRRQGAAWVMGWGPTCTQGVHCRRPHVGGCKLVERKRHTLLSYHPAHLPFYPSAFLAGAFCFCSLKLCAVGNLRHPRGFCVEQAGLSACMCLCQQYVDSGTPCASSCSLQCSHVSPPAALQAMIRSGTQPSIILKFTECWLVLTNLYGRRSVQ